MKWLPPILLLALLGISSFGCTIYILPAPLADSTARTDTLPATDSTIGGKDTAVTKDTTTGPILGAELVVNGNFPTTAGTHNMTSTDIPPWAVYYDTPQLVPAWGADGTRGYLQIYGLQGDGEAVYEPLASSLKKDSIYQLVIRTRFTFAGNLLNDTHVRVSVFAYNTAPATKQLPWYTNGTDAAKLIAVNRYASDSNWRLDTVLFRASNTFSKIVVWADGDNPSKAGWAHVDDVSIRQKIK